MIKRGVLNESGFENIRKPLFLYVLGFIAVVFGGPRGTRTHDPLL